MATVGTKAEIKLRNILYLTDFSGPSEAALSFAIALGRGYGAKVHALHILLPTPYPYAYAAPGLTALALDAVEENAQAEMQKVESQLAGLQYETTVERGVSVWPGVEPPRCSAKTGDCFRLREFRPEVQTGHQEHSVPSRGGQAPSARRA